MKFSFRIFINHSSGAVHVAGTLDAKSASLIESLQDLGIKVDCLSSGDIEKILAFVLFGALYKDITQHRIRYSISDLRAPPSLLRATSIIFFDQPQTHHHYKRSI